MTMGDSPIEASIAPWMVVSDGAKAVEYYRNALGAVERYRLEHDGRVTDPFGHDWEFSRPATT
jgi:uncharacterized glyoxalase superfamily protein PhnB